MMKRTFTAMLLATTLTGCLTSPPALTVARADSQRGQFGSVYMSDGTQYSGELLALDDSTITMLTRDRIAIGSLSRVSELYFDEFATSEVGPERGLSASTLRKGRHASRFPYGITPSVLATLLADARQSAPDRLQEMNR